MNWMCWRDPNHKVQPHPQFGWPRCAECGAAPDYPERHSYVPKDLKLPIYVPNASAPAPRVALFAARSAIVGIRTTDGGWTFVHYEGWVHGAAQYEGRDARGKWEAGVQHAAGRGVVSYPTSAATMFPVKELRQVGTYHPASDTITVTDEEVLTEWLTKDG